MLVCCFHLSPTTAPIVHVYMGAGRCSNRNQNSSTTTAVWHCILPPRSKFAHSTPRMNWFPESRRTSGSESLWYVLDNLKKMSHNFAYFNLICISKMVNKSLVNLLIRIASKSHIVIQTFFYYNFLNNLTKKLTKIHTTPINFPVEANNRVKCLKEDTFLAIVSSDYFRSFWTESTNALKQCFLGWRYCCGILNQWLRWFMLWSIMQGPVCSLSCLKVHSSEGLR